METKKKIILGVALAGAAAFIFKDKLFPSSSTAKIGANTSAASGGSYAAGPVSKFEGRVVEATSANGLGRSKVIRGYRIPYTNNDAWIADGRPPVFMLSDADYLAIPNDFNYVISETGFGPRTVFV